MHGLRLLLLSCVFRVLSVGVELVFVLVIDGVTEGLR